MLASAHATDKKSVELSFLGKGTRRVRVGYIQETPVWKTTYRLVLSDEQKPFLQGWAIVENTSEEDWNDVQSDPGQRPADLLHDGPLPAALHPAAARSNWSFMPRCGRRAYGQDLADEGGRVQAKGRR